MNTVPKNVAPTFEFGIAIGAGVVAGAPIAQLRNISRNNNGVVVPTGTPYSFIGLTLLEIVLTDATVTDLALAQVLTDGTFTTNTTGVWVNRKLAVGSFAPWDPRGLLAIATAWSAAPTFSAPPISISKRDSIAVKGNRVIWEWPEEDPLIIHYDNTTSWCVQNIGGGAAGAMSISGRFQVYPAAGTNP